MVYVDVPGLPKNFNVKYRPPRVSLFPPSYQDRAFLRSIHRDVLHQTALLKNDADKKGVEPAKVEAKPKKASTAAQTVESHCYHACPAHPQEETHIKKHRELKACCCMKKAQESDTDDSNDNSDDSDEDCSKYKKCKNKKKKHTKSKSHKNEGKDEPDFKIPDSIRPFLPYPLSSPNGDLFWGKNFYQQPFVERPFIHKADLPGWNLDYKLEAARQADEKYVWNVLAQRGGNDQQSAFQWLADRDRQRQAKLAHAAYDLANLSLDPKSDRTPLAFPPGRSDPYLQSPGVNYGGCPCVNTHGNHSLHGQHNQQHFKRHEPSGNQWSPNETGSGNGGFDKSSKMKDTLSPGSNNGQQNTKDSGSQHSGGDGLRDMQHHPFFADNSPIAETHHNDHGMSGGNSPGPDRWGSTHW